MRDERLQIEYVQSNHLGNVLAVISDWKLPVISGASVISYTPVVVSSQDYSPFCVTLSGRSWSAGYRYGFNGKELDTQGMGGGGNTYDYGFRIYNPYLGRFLSIDPLTSSYPWNSTYAFAENRIIDGIDLDGCKYVSINRHTIDGVTVQLNINKVQNPSSAPLAPPITETVTTHNTNPAGQVVQSTTFPTSMNSASVDSQVVMSDVNGAGAASTQGRLATVPAPAPRIT
jgi:RHS repeat-associated protein